MLVLTRKFGETIHIGDDITITVVALDHNKVRLGIEAPRDTPVHRKEIFEQIGSAPVQPGRRQPAG